MVQPAFLGLVQLAAAETGASRAASHCRFRIHQAAAGGEVGRCAFQGDGGMERRGCAIYAASRGRNRPHAARACNLQPPISSIGRIAGTEEKSWSADDSLA